jgi:hypothetical protein
VSHLDEEAIALRALGEELDTAFAAHLVECETCRLAVADLERVVAVGRSGSAGDALVSPPAAVWAAIAAEVGIATTASATASGVGAAAGGRGVDGTRTPDRADSTTDGSRVLPLAGRGRLRRVGRSPWAVAAAVAAGLVVGIAGTLGWQVLTNEEQVLASATLDPLPGQEGQATVSVVDGAFGRTVEVTMDAEPPPGQLLEVWLLTEDRQHMVPIGVLEPGAEGGSWEMPEGVTFSAYPVVDVSIEPDDGDPAHSGNIMMQGTLAPALAPDADV